MKTIYLLVFISLGFNNNLFAQNIIVEEITTLGEALSQGKTNILISQDGTPIVSYAALSNGSGSLNIYKCNNVQCSNGGVMTVLDDEFPNVGSINAMAMGGDGFPIISYYDSFNFSLKVIKCTSIDCTEFLSPVTLDGNGVNDASGEFTKIVIGDDGNPIISYLNITNSFDAELKVIACTTPSCSGHNPPVSLYVGDNKFNSLAIGADGNPIVSFYDSVANELRFVKCTSPTCSTFEDSLVLIDSQSGDYGEFSSIAAGASGNPVISYSANDSDDALKFISCLDAGCSQMEDPITLDISDTDVGSYVSMAIDSNGFPVMSYHDFGNFSMKMIKCTAIDCSTFSPPIVAELGGINTFTNLGWNNNITIANNGRLFVSYLDSFSGTFKVLTANYANSNNLVFKNSFEQ